MAKTLKKSMKKPHRKMSRQKRRTQKRGGETTNPTPPNPNPDKRNGFFTRAIGAVERLKYAGRVLDLQAIIGEMSKLEFRRFKKNMVLLSDDKLEGTKNNEDRFNKWNTSDEAIAAAEEAAAKEAAAKAAAEAAPAGGKWSKKYKRSINCRRPKGFSQRQHCKYGRKSRKSRK